jgi:ABC-type dipeptide/oligopeptide/nickel transport system ATPase subunit
LTRRKRVSKFIKAANSLKMTTKSSRRLVIDASVARSSGGEDAVFPTSKNCRDFLKAVLEICHHVVLTLEIREEWHKHQSKFSKRWLRSMFARKKVELIDSTEDQMLRDRIAETSQNQKARAAMLKDIHLLEATLVTDEIVVALDETVRALFIEVAVSVGEIRNVIWTNPDRADEAPLPWLEGGAKSDKKRCLGAEWKMMD